MAACKNCGKDIPPDQVVCDACAAKFASTAQPKAESTPPVDPIKPAPAVADPASKAVGIFTYFGLFLLFAIPLVGLIASVIFAFAPKSSSLKNFARAVLIWKVIGILIIALLIASLSSLIASVVKDATGFDLSALDGLRLRDISTVAELGTYIENEDMEGVVSMVKDGKLDDILDRAKQGEFDTLIESLDDAGANELLNSIKNGELDAEIDKIKRGEYDDEIANLIQNSQAFPFEPAA